MFRSLKSRLILLLALVFLPSVVTIYYYISLHREHVIEQGKQRAVEVARQLEVSQQEMIERTEFYLKYLATIPQIQDPSSPECGTFLAAALKLNTAYANVGVPRADGELLCNALQLSHKVNVFDRPYFQNSLINKTFSIGTYQLDRATERTSINFAYPVIPRPGGEVVGLVVAVVSLDWWSRQLSEYRLPEGTVALISDSEGNIVANYPKDMSKHGKPAEQYGLYFSGKRRFDGVTFLLKGIDGISRIFTHQTLYTKADGRSVIVSVGIPIDGAIQAADDQFFYALSIFSGFFLIMLLLANLGLNRSVVRPLNKLVEASFDLEAGRFVKGSLQGGARELRWLNQRFENMAEARLNAENQAHQRSNELDSVFDALPDLYFRLNAEGVILDYKASNPSELYVTPAHFLGHKMGEVLPSGSATLFTEQIKRHLVTRDLTTWEYSLPIAEKTQYFEARACSIRNSNETIVVVRNISERKQAEESLRRAQKMEAIGQLTGGIAHDFNNILGIIIGNLELLKHQVTDDDILKRVETIYGTAQRAANLTKQLLGFSRQHVTQRISTDIRRIIREMDSLIAGSLTPEIVIEQQFAEDLWQAEIDPGDFQDTLLNLVINARDAMPSGGQLILEARNCTLDTSYCAQNPGAAPGEYVQLAVSDSGIGIAPEDREKIFEPFFTTKPQDKGTGLGLAMVYAFAKRSGGYVQVYSELGVGTTFRLYLPRGEGEDQEQKTTSESAERLRRGNETLLVVDDEQGLLVLAEETLQTLGYRVLTANSGRQAMELLSEEPSVALLFSDVVMPGGMNGYELAELATNAYPQLKVLLTSGYTGRALAHNGQARFAVNLLSKPYRQAELTRAVRSLLDESDILEPTDNEPGLTPAQTNVKAIERTYALSIGVDALDAEHETLHALIDRCQQTMAVKGGEQQMQSLLDELNDSVQTHFQREEVMMVAVGYPGFENHRQVHQLLLKQLEKRRAQLMRGELTIGDLEDLFQSWLLDHFDNMDGAIKPFCEGKNDLIEQAWEQASIAREKEDPS